MKASAGQLDDLQWVFKALSYKKRLQILELLLNRGPMTVGEISERLNSPVATISRNLAFLSRSGFVIGENKGIYTLYTIRKNNSLQNIVLLALIKDATRRKKKGGLALVSAAMFEPRMGKFLEILSSSEYE